VKLTNPETSPFRVRTRYRYGEDSETFDDPREALAFYESRLTRSDVSGVDIFGGFGHIPAETVRELIERLDSRDEKP